MNAMTLALLERVKSLVPEEGDWFNTLRAWYKHVKFTRRLIEELRSDEETALLSLRVGEQPVATAPEWQGRHVHWLIPAECLATGDNTLRVSLDAEAQAPLFLDAGSASQDDGLAQQTVDLSVPEPKPAPNLAMSRSGEARHQADCWAVFPKGFLRFQLHLSTPRPVHFMLRLPEGRSLPWPKAKTERRQKLLEDVIERVKERVEEKLSALEQELRESRRRADGRVGELEGDLNDLRAYEELHRKQIDKAVHSAVAITMETVIRETGFPDDLIRRMLPITVTPVMQQIASPPPARPLRPRSSGKTSAAQSTSMFGKLLFLAALVSTAAVGGWEIYQNDALANLWNQAGNGKNEGLGDVLKTRGAQTGEVQVSLFWHNKNDLDLHVVSPFKANGMQDEEVSFRAAQKPARSPSGGQLDVDANLAVDALRDDPIENIHWPEGMAPQGNYKVYVVLFKRRDLPGCEDPTRFTVRVVVRGQERIVDGKVLDQIELLTLSKGRELLPAILTGAAQQLFCLSRIWKIAPFGLV